MGPTDPRVAEGTSPPPGPALTPAQQELTALARDFPAWHFWDGVAGLRYARVPGAEPPVVVRGHNLTVLRERVAAKDAEIRGGPAVTGPDPAPKDVETEFPGWEVFRGTDEMWYARLSGAEPPIVLRDENTTELRERVRAWVAALNRR
jgi:hypothetical protein